MRCLSWIVIIFICACAGSGDSTRADKPWEKKSPTVSLNGKSFDDGMIYTGSTRLAPAYQYSFDDAEYRMEITDRGYPEPELYLIERGNYRLEGMLIQFNPTEKRVCILDNRGIIYRCDPGGYYDDSIIITAESNVSMDIKKTHLKSYSTQLFYENDQHHFRTDRLKVFSDRFTERELLE